MFIPSDKVSLLLDTYHKYIIRKIWKHSSERYLSRHWLLNRKKEKRKIRNNLNIKKEGKVNCKTVIKQTIKQSLKWILMMLRNNDGVIVSGLCPSQIHMLKS